MNRTEILTRGLYFPPVAISSTIQNYAIEKIQDLEKTSIYWDYLSYVPLADLIYGIVTLLKKRTALIRIDFYA